MIIKGIHLSLCPPLMRNIIDDVFQVISQTMASDAVIKDSWYCLSLFVCFYSLLEKEEKKRRSWIIKRLLTLKLICNSNGKCTVVLFLENGLWSHHGHVLHIFHWVSVCLNNAEEDTAPLVSVWHFLHFASPLTAIEMLPGTSCQSLLFNFMTSSHPTPPHLTPPSLEMFEHLSSACPCGQG